MESLRNIYEQVSLRIKAYVPPMSVFVEETSRLDVYSDRPVDIDGRKRNNVFFASVILYPTYVGFYYMPVYAKPEIAALFSQELLALLKGKSCFHLKKETPNLYSDIEQALAQGFDLYRQKGWVK